MVDRASQLINRTDPDTATNCFNTALFLYAEIENAWDTTCCGTSHGDVLAISKFLTYSTGGIWWNSGHSSKATASNAGPALLSAILYQSTGDSRYLEFSEKVFSVLIFLRIGIITSSSIGGIIWSTKGQVKCVIIFRQMVTKHGGNSLTMRYLLKSELLFINC